MPFVERLEYIGISSCLLIILPNICVAIWISSRLIKRTNSQTQTKDQRTSYRNPLFNHLCYFSDERRN
ncbi:hypothetical protein [Bacillus methanolicus]|uniref:hypothetical protein n=1 Tax=Bacillus methanolicus TaxID=1471 RepID=UPI003D80A412